MNIKGILIAFAAIGIIAGTVMLLNDHETKSTLLQQTRIDIFKQWQLRYRKSYASPQEEEERFQVWQAKYDWVQSHNSNPANSYQVEVGKFADKAKVDRTKACRLQNQQAPLENTQEIVQDGELPASVDWRTTGAVTPIKNQGQCGSCWAFSATGSLEGLAFLTTGNLPSLSEQQLVDCAGGKYGNQGCNGGLEYMGMAYVADKGVETEANYPYKAVDQKCKYSQSKVVFQNQGYKLVKVNDNDQLKAAAAAHPTSVAIEADSESFQNYKSGVYDDKGCGTNLDHAVLVVGYGSLNNKNYWIVKNSWGTDWGDQGYILIYRQSGMGPGICGIASGPPSYPYGNKTEEHHHRREFVAVHDLKLQQEQQEEETTATISEEEEESQMDIQIQFEEEAQKETEVVELHSQSEEEEEEFSEQH